MFLASQNREIESTIPAAAVTPRPEMKHPCRMPSFD
jgi:hypothetical protein